MSSTRSVAAVFLAIVFLLPHTLFAADSVMNLVPMPIPESAEEIHKVLGDFPHADYDKAGCYLLSLPFRYSSDQQGFDQSEAHTFAFLMSADLDWIPGNYCSRHAYFVLERDARAMKALEKRYNSISIQRRIAKWQATSAIGGELRRTNTGIGGTLEIYDSTGRLSFSKAYNPRDYFQLLGDMDVDVMRQAGYDPPATLAKYLHQPRCQHQESIAAVGKTCYVPWVKMTDIFPDILAKDPTFGEAYAWWAHMYSWRMDQSHEAQQQIVQALSGRITELPLADVDISTVDEDPQLVELYRGFVDRASQLVGEDSTAVIIARMNLAAAEGLPKTSEFDRALRQAAKYPNDQLLLSTLEHLFNDVVADPDPRLGGALAWVDQHSLNTPGIGDKRFACQSMADSLYLLGRPDLAVTAIRQYEDPGNERRLLESEYLLSAFRPRDVLNVYAEGPIDDDADGEQLAAATIVAAALLGDLNTIDQVSRDWNAEFERDGFSPMITIFLNARAGQPFTTEQFNQIGKVQNPQMYVKGAELAILADQMLNTDAASAAFYGDYDQFPFDRQNWALMDAHIRRTGHPAADGFYDALAWLFPQDTWVKQANEYFHHHPPANAPAHDSPEDILKDQEERLSGLEKLRSSHELTRPKILSALNSYLNAHNLAASVHYLLQKGQRAAAHELAIRYQAIIMAASSLELRAWASMLVRLTSN